MQADADTPEDDRKTPSEEPFSDEPSADDEPLDDDLPCIRCHYNLRGLKSGGNCPECGAPIHKSLDYAMERILCLACMKPNHPSAAVCSGCGSPLHTAGATADYFRLQPRGVRRRPDLDEATEAQLAKMQTRQKPQPAPRPSPAGVVFIAVFFALLAVALLSLASVAWTNGDDGVSAMLILLAFAVLATSLLPWRKYVRQRDAYLAYRSRRLRELQDAPASTPDAPAEDNDGEPKKGAPDDVPLPPA